MSQKHVPCFASVSLAILFLLSFCPIRAGETADVRALMAGVDYEVAFDPHDPESAKGVPVNFDNAATTPALKSVIDAITEEMNTYAAIGRSHGAKSTISTDRYEQYRRTVLTFFGADAAPGREDKYAVVYVNNTTDGLNRLSSMLLDSKDDLVLTTRMEHHANDLPWRDKGTVIYADVDSHGRLDMDEVRRLLVENSGKVKYVAVTAASNMTGFVNDVHAIARLAHKHGARIVVDGAQIAAHKPFSMFGKTEEEDIDFFVFSAHKIYAPFGGGAIIGVKDILERVPPAWHGGGNVSLVTDSTERLIGPPDRHEAGSPNYFGVVALHRALEDIMSDKIGGFDYMVDHEMRLLERMVNGLRRLPEVRMLNFCADPSCPTHADGNILDGDRVGIVVFNVDGMSSRAVAKALALRGFALREGAFCAHVYASRLLDVSEEKLKRVGHPPRMLRISFGMYNNEAEVDAFLKALAEIIDAGLHPHPTDKPQHDKGA